MSRVVVVNFLSLDGVMQSVLSTDEDREGGFEQGGWVPGYVDEIVERVMSDATVQADGLLFGRKTYQIFAARWPYASQDEPAVAAMNRIPKYVASHTMRTGDWNNTTVLGPDTPKAVAELKDKPGGDLVVFGSGGLIQTLIEHDLVDEFRLLLLPLVIGNGKRLFPDGGAPADLRLVDTVTSQSGVVVLTYHPTRPAPEQQSRPEGLR
jgi:dihydrofolate reductase